MSQAFAVRVFQRERRRSGHNLETSHKVVAEAVEDGEFVLPFRQTGEGPFYRIFSYSGDRGGGRDRRSRSKVFQLDFVDSRRCGVLGITTGVVAARVLGADENRSAASAARRNHGPLRVVLPKLDHRLRRVKGLRGRLQQQGVAK